MGLSGNSSSPVRSHEQLHAFSSTEPQTESRWVGKQPAPRATKAKMSEFQAVTTRRSQKRLLETDSKSRRIHCTHGFVATQGTAAATQSTDIFYQGN